MAPERLRASLRIGVLALLVLSSLPFGSVQPWAVFVIELSAAGLGALAVAVVLRENDSLPKEARLLAIPVAVLLGVGVLQLLPAPRQWVALVARPTLEARDAVTRVLPELTAPLAPMSLSPPDTIDALLRLTGYALIGLATAVGFTRRAHVRQATLTIIAIGAFQAIYGSAQYLSGRQHIFGYAKQHYLEEATGTFINRNHFAAFLAMALPLALCHLPPRARVAGRRTSWRRRLTLLSESSTFVPLAAGIAAFAIWVGVLLSYSRGGLSAALIATATVSLLLLSRRRIRWLLLASVIPVAFLCWQEVKAPGERFSDLDGQLTSEAGRLMVWRSSARMIHDYPALGSGFGTFESAYGLYRPATVHLRWDHAHNDWLQVVLEGGLVSGLAAAMLLGCVLFRPRVGALALGRRDPLAAGVAAAIAAIAAHSFLDFSLRIPAVAVLLSTLLGLAAALAVCLSGAPSPLRARQPRRRRTGGA